VFEETFADRHSETSMFVIEDDAGRRLLGGLSFDVTERYRAHQRSAALLELNTLGNELDETAFMARALAQVERLTHSAMGFLHLVSDDHRTLELVTWGRGAQRVDDCAEGRQIAEELASLWGDAVRTRQAILLEDLAVYASHRGLANSFSAVQRVACVPVQEGGRVRMLLGVCNKAAAYDAFDTETMQLLGNDLWRIVCRNRVEIVLQQRVEELVALNQKLSSIQLQLLQSEKMASIGQLASGVAHEINNPIGFVKSNLTSLSTYIDNLVDVLHAYEEVQTAQEATDTAAFGQVNRIKREVDYNFLIDDLKQLIAESADGVQRVNQIVQDLKNFSHTADGRREWADLNAGIDSTINVVWNQLKYKVNLKREFGDLPPVRCIASQINQVVMNLLVNAGHAIAGQGHITVRTGVEGSSVWIEVEDDGSGISEENQHRIFEPFFTTKPVGQGTGLGLSISFGIVQRHHGAITMRSALGQGTTFRITLPVDAPMESKE
jgi:signal transduction histidine kinase